MGLVVDQKLVEKLESDLRRMTKLYKSIPTTAEHPDPDNRWVEDYSKAHKVFREVEELFKTFRNRVEEIVYDQVLGQLPLREHADAHESKESWAAKQLREKAWKFYIDLGGLFPDTYAGESQKSEYAQKSVGGYYLPDIVRLRSKRETNIRRYQKSARDFLVAFRDFIQHETARGRSLERMDSTERTKIAGFNVVIHNKGRYGDESEASLEAAMRDVFDGLHDARAQIQKAGFGRAFRDLVIHIGYSRHRGRGVDAAGTYNRDADELYIHRGGLEWFDKNDPNHVFVHELGHRFYYKNLGNKARDHWDSVIKDRLTEVTKEGIDAWLDVVGPMYDASEREKGHRFVGSEDAAKAFAEASRRSVNPEILAQMHYLAREHPSGPKSADELRMHHLKFHLGEKVAIEHITDYGATNPQEAFAEAFRLYVTKGPGALGEWTRAFFREISEYGDVRVRASTVAAGYMKVDEKLIGDTVSKAVGVLTYLGYKGDQDKPWMFNTAAFSGYNKPIAEGRMADASGTSIRYEVWLGRAKDSRTTGHATRLRNDFVKIEIFPPKRPEHEEELAKDMRSVLAHEFAHAADPTIRIDVEKGRKGPAPGGPAPKTDLIEYFNRPREVRARLSQVARQLSSKEAVEALRDEDPSFRFKRFAYPPLEWANQFSSVWQEEQKFFSAANRKLFLKVIGERWQAALDQAAVGASTVADWHVAVEGDSVAAYVQGERVGGVQFFRSVKELNRHIRNTDQAPFSFEEGGKVGYISVLEIPASMQGKGVGTQIARALLSEAKGLGARAVFLHAGDPASRSSARQVSFWYRIGFDRLRYDDGTYWHQPMVYKLSGSANVSASTGYLFHITTPKTAALIAAHGFDPSKGKSQGGGSLFFSTTGKRSAGWWDTIWGLRVALRTSAAVASTPDPYGAGDVKVSEKIRPSEIEWFDPGDRAWKPISTFDADEYERAFTDQSGLYSNRTRSALLSGAVDKKLTPGLHAIEARGTGFDRTFRNAAAAYLAGGPPEPLIEALDAFKALFQAKPDGTLNAPWLLALSRIKINKLVQVVHRINFVRYNLERMRDSSGNPVSRQGLEIEIKALEKAAKQVDLLAGAEQEGGFPHGPFTIKVLPGVTRKQVDAALNALDKATTAIQKKFPHVLYGPIYMSTKVGGHKTAAHYVRNDDVIHLSPQHISATDGFDIHAIAHELGHRYDHKFADRKLMSEFVNLSIHPVMGETVYDEALRRKVADEVVNIVTLKKLGMGIAPMSKETETWLASPSGVRGTIKDAVSKFMAGRIDEAALHKAAMGSGDRTITLGTVVRPPLAVSEYGKTSPTENFAEAFAFYVLGKELPPELKSVLDRMAR